MNFPRITLWDTIVNIVPGTTTILIFVALLPNGVYEQLLTFSLTGIAPAILLLVVSYVIGLLLQHYSKIIDKLLHNGLSHDSMVDRWLYEHLPEKSRIHSWRHNGFFDFEDPFKAELNKARKVDEKHDHRTHRRRYLKGSQLFFSDRKDAAADQGFDDGQLRELTWSHLVNEGADRSARFEILYVLMRSLYALFGTSAVIASILFIASLQGVYEMTWDVFGGTLLITLLSIGTIFAYKRRKKYHVKLDKSIITDFYTLEIANKE